MAGYVDLIEVFNVVLTLIMVFFGTRIFLSFKKANMELLKARMFLTKGLVNRMWMYSSSSGGFFVLHVLILNLNYWGYPTPEVLRPLTLGMFLVPFVLLTKAWYNLIISSLSQKSKDEGFEVSPKTASSEHSASQP